MRRAAPFILIAFWLGACATVQGGVERLDAGAEHLGEEVSDTWRDARARVENGLTVEEGALIADPFEPFNRRVFAFNQQLDRYALGPASRVYGTVIPRTGRARVRDFIDHWKTPLWLANDILQADWDGAGMQTSRFVINTTFGVLGAYDIAAAVEGEALPKVDEDFGQTLGEWGFGEGAYLVLPAIGPSSTRDTLGIVVDRIFDPVNAASFDNELAWRAALTATDIVDLRYQADDVVQVLNNSTDPYIQARTIYVQARRDRLDAAEDAARYDDLPEF